MTVRNSNLIRISSFSLLSTHLQGILHLQKTHRQEILHLLKTLLLMMTLLLVSHLLVSHLLHMTLLLVSHLLIILHNMTLNCQINKRLLQSLHLSRRKSPYHRKKRQNLLIFLLHQSHKQHLLPTNQSRNPFIPKPHTSSRKP